jgi:hypothetical protein
LQYYLQYLTYKGITTKGIGVKVALLNKRHKGKVKARILTLGDYHRQHHSKSHSLFFKDEKKDEFFQVDGNMNNGF